MASNKPEFFYHPAVGVVSPASLGLFAFKQGPISVQNAPAPKPLTRVTTPEAAATTVSTEAELKSTASATAIAAAAPLPETPAVIAPAETKPEVVEMKKPSRHDARHETCIVSGEEHPHTEMIRFVIDPDENIVPDLAEKLPGKGFWVKANRDLLKKAVWRNSFTTAARTPVKVSKNLPEQVEIALLRQSMETIGLARKAGLVTHGFAKAEEVLRDNKAVLYVVASDASEQVREKLEKLASSIPVLDIWTSSQLSAALGEDNAVHVVFTAGGLTEKLQIIAQKLKDIR